MAKGKFTIDHETIRRWAEERDGHPARVKATGKKGARGRSDGLLRIDFGEPEASLETISWEEFFDAFEENSLAFLHQDKTADGQTSRFFKFVDRDSVADDVKDDGGAEEASDEDDDDEEDDENDADDLQIAEAEVKNGDGADEEDDEDDEEEEEEE